MVDLEALVIGAGVVGLAIARSLSSVLGSVAVVDRHHQIGMETSSRNSEVIHAGLYYQTGSKKAEMCREGRMALYQYCKARGVNHRKCGKLIVAAGNDAEKQLLSIKTRAEANKVESLILLDRAAVMQMEPEVECDMALFSPETGIIDSHGFMNALAADFENEGGVISLRTTVERVVLGEKYHDVFFAGEPVPIRTRRLINAAGLWADKLAYRFDGLAPSHIPELRFARGVYFVPGAGKQNWFDRLIYPLPDSSSLGVHATIDLDGAVRFGPDVEWIASNDDYAVDPSRSAAFKRSIAAYFPAIANIDLVPGYAGIRPKLVGPGEPPADFRIDGPTEHNVDGLVNLFGIESPGLTSSLPIAENVLKRLC